MRNHGVLTVVLALSIHRLAEMGRLMLATIDLTTVIVLHARRIGPAMVGGDWNVIGHELKFYGGDR